MVVMFCLKKSFARRGRSTVRNSVLEERMRSGELELLSEKLPKLSDKMES